MLNARSARLALVSAAVLFAAGPARSDTIIVLTGPVTLQEAMGMPEGLRVADKVFSDWSYTCSSKDGGNAPDPAAIAIEGVRVEYADRTEHGLRFTGNWSALASQLVDTVIRYKLAVDDPFWLIDNTLWMSGSGAAGCGMVTITENVYETYPPQGAADEIAWKYTYRSAAAGSILAHVDFAQPHKTLWIVTDVGVNGGSDPPANPVGSASVSEFYETFSQTPEPGSLVLLGLGALVILTARRRRR